MGERAAVRISPRDLRRSCLVVAMATLAGVGLCNAVAGAPTKVEVRAVGSFQTVLWLAAGELTIEQTHRERLSVEAEPHVLAKLVTELRDGQLTIAFAPGTSVQTQWPIRVRLELKSLSALVARGSGTLRLGPLRTPALSLHLEGSEDLRLARLDADRLEVRLDGSGDLAIEGGQVRHQQVVISGAGRYHAAHLASRTADVALDGSGELRVAVSERLDARIDGSGDVLYVGQPLVRQRVRGAGAVHRLAAPPR